MKTTKLTLNADLEDGSKMSLSLPAGAEFTYTPVTPTPTPVPTPVPTPTNKKYVMLNCITWPTNPLTNLPNEASEYTYFVIPVKADGSFVSWVPGSTGASDTLEKKFVADVKAKGKKVTFSIAGGAQNVVDITSAVTTNRASFINNIYNHLVQYGYHGVTVDIENTSINPDVMVTFFKELRAKLGPDKIIGVYVQPYQFNTVWSKIEQAASSITWLSSMNYDYANTVAQAEAETLRWLPKVGGDKSKLLFGAAVNYDSTGLDLTEWPQILDWVNAQGLGGVGVWQNEIYTQPYRDVLKAKFPNI